MDQLDRQKMGVRLRAARKHLDLTLEQASERAGLSTAHLSKAERGQISLSYEKFVALAKTLGISLEKLFSGQDAPPTPPRISVNLAGEGVAYQAESYFYGMLANDVPGKKMTPMMGRASARSVEEFPDFVRHQGEEFVFVLKGHLKVQFEDGRLENLKRGDSIYFDSSIGHLYLSEGKTDAEFLVVCSDH